MPKALLIYFICAGLALGQTDRPRDLTEASLEQLMNIQVTSVSKKGERLGKTAASVYVITAEDIRRSGLRSLPEILRLAPGVQVARSSAGSWAISIRGFNDELANKLLVLVDGRSIYGELFSGVFWETQQIPPDDIERIEVIRGPGAAMWGTNAVNGVINIITKSAADTRGGLMTMESGTEGEITASARYGGAIGHNASYRLGVLSSRYDQLHPLLSRAPSRGWGAEGVDFRIDWDPTESDALIISGQGYNSSAGHLFGLVSLTNPVAPPVDSRDLLSGGDLLVRWQHRYSPRSSLEAQFTWDDTDLDDPQFGVKYQIVNFEIKHHVAIGGRNDFIWGTSFRRAAYDFDPSIYHITSSGSAPNDVYAIFAEDHLTLVEDKLQFIAGAHAGHNSFTGLEVQPTARLLWTPTDKTSTWLAVSRAVRTPSLYDRGFDGITTVIPVQPGMFAYVRSLGDPKFQSETELSYEAGERVQVSKRVALDASAFYSTYDRLESIVGGTPYFVTPTAATPAHLEIPAVITNSRSASVYGGELTATWAATDRWRLLGGYSTVFIHTHPTPGVDSFDTLRTEGSTPRHQFQVRSNRDLTRTLQFDAAGYFASSLVVPPTTTVLELRVPTHFRGDFRLGWRLSDRLDLSAGVQDAFDNRHSEFMSVRFPEALQVRRNVYGAVRWQF